MPTHDEKFNTYWSAIENITNNQRECERTEKDEQTNNQEDPVAKRMDSDGNLIRSDMQNHDMHPTSQNNIIHYLNQNGKGMEKRISNEIDDTNCDKGEWTPL